MRLCPKCGTKTQLKSVYCPDCGAKMEFIEDQIVGHAAEEMRTERETKLAKQLTQWLAIASVIMILGFCFKNLANRMPDVSAPPVFYGPPVVGSSKGGGVLVIGKGDGYLDLSVSAFPIPEVAVSEADDVGDGDTEQVLVQLSEAGSITITKKAGTIVSGKLLGKTGAFLTVEEGDEIKTISRSEVESIQKAEAP